MPHVRIEMASMHNVDYVPEGSLQRIVADAVVDGRSLTGPWGGCARSWNWKRKRHVTQHAQMTYWRNVETLATQPHVRETELLPTLELQHHTIDSSLQSSVTLCHQHARLPPASPSHSFQDPSPPSATTHRHVLRRRCCQRRAERGLGKSEMEMRAAGGRADGKV